MRGARFQHRAHGPWHVRARVERFSEPLVLLLLREQPAHGYELLEALAQLLPDGERVDMGNLYRTLRALEDDGLVSSQWDYAAAGPAKRVYELTDAGRHVLDDWAGALTRARARIDAFLGRYEERG
jgi:PadR family transcriptional regulator, regulatory protein PadR